MNALAHHTDLTLLTEHHNRQIRELCSSVTNAVFAEARRIAKSGRTVSLALGSDFISVYVHEGDQIVLSAHPATDCAEELIELLGKLEKISSIPDVEECYDLEEDAAADG